MEKMGSNTSQIMNTTDTNVLQTIWSTLAYEVQDKLYVQQLQYHIR